MTEYRMTYFTRPLRGRCECCNRQQNLEQKILLLDGTGLIGDLNLCSDCAAAWEELLGQKNEKVIQEWDFTEKI